MRYIIAISIALTGKVAFAEADHELARRASMQHEIISLGDVLAIVTEDYSATPTGIELERLDDRYVYRLKLFSAEGRMIEVVLDAANGEILGEEGG